MQEIKAGTDELTDESLRQHVSARASMGRLLLADPEHFVKVLPVSGNTFFEEVTCVGLEPQQRALYATIDIKRTTGYGGDLCDGPGNREYVRFFVDWNGDGDFTDMGDDVGVASVAVHDVPGPKPLTYVVSVALTAAQQVCFLAKPRRVRAVLSYGSVPPAGNPTPPVVWGNIRDAWVQPEPTSLRLVDVLDITKVKLKTDLAELVDLEVPLGPPKALSAATLAKTYGDKVHLHRQLAPQLAQAKQALEADAAKSAALPELLGPGLPAGLVSGIDFGGLLGSYLDLDGDTSYEELHCIGLHPDLSALVGVLEIKKPSGYSGGLCSTGSLEYVSFWADWDDSGSFDEYLGTTAVRVHDQSMPAGGLRFAVFLPVNLASRRRPCGEGHVARIRAVLSWNTAPSSTNPFDVPAWGNAVEARVQLPVGTPLVGQVPFISSVANMAVMDINSAGYASGTAVTAGFNASNSPFGGIVTIAGHISNPPDLSAGAPGLRYGLRYRHESEPAGTFHDITDPFQVTLTKWSGFTWSQTHPTQTVDGAMTYAYHEDLTPNGPGGDQTFVEGFVLGKWQTAGLPDGRYEIWMVTDTGAGPVSSNKVWVRLDNTAPQVDLTLTGSQFVPKGTPLSGTATATDAHFGAWSLSVLPAGYPHSPAPAGGTSPVTAQAFTLATSSATTGGYVLHLAARDRTIVNSGAVGRWATRDVGFCVEAP